MRANPILSAASACTCASFSDIAKECCASRSATALTYSFKCMWPVPKIPYALPSPGGRPGGGGHGVREPRLRESVEGCLQQGYRVPRAAPGDCKGGGRPGGGGQGVRKSWHWPHALERVRQRRCLPRSTTFLGNIAEACTCSPTQRTTSSWLDCSICSCDSFGLVPGETGLGPFEMNKKGVNLGVPS
jgi:hypothetical protein